MAENVVIRVSAETRAALNAITGLQRGGAQAFQRLALAGVAAFGGITYAATAMTRRLTDAAVEMGNLQQRLRAGLDDEFGEGLEFVREEAERLGLALQSTAKGYGSLTAATRGTNLEGAASREIFLGIAEAMVVTGGSAAETEGALQTIEQIVSKGVVSMEELRRQLGNRIPGAFQIAARAMGLTTEQLDDLVSSGQLMAEDFLPRFARQLREEMGPKLAAALNTPAREFQRLDNALFEMRAALGTALLPVILRAAEALRDFARAAGGEEALGSVEKLVAAVQPLTETIGRLIKLVTDHPKALAAFFDFNTKSLRAGAGLLDFVLKAGRVEEVTALASMGGVVKGGLRELTKGLLQGAPGLGGAGGADSATEPLPPLAGGGVSKGGAKATATAARARNELLQQEAEVAYERQLITLEEYLERRYQLAEEAFNIERQFIEQSVKDEAEANDRKAAARSKFESELLEIQELGRREAENAQRLSEQDRTKAVREAVRDQLEARRVADEQYRQELSEIDQAVERGLLTRKEAQELVNEATREYARALREVRAELETIQQAAPDIADAADDIARINTDLTQLQGNIRETSFFGVLREELQLLAAEWANVSQNMAGALTGGLQSAFNGLGQSVAGLIDGTSNWGQTFQNVAKGIIANIVSIVAQWIASMVIVQGLKAAFGARDKAEAATTAAAWAPAAAASSVGSSGGSAIAGLAALVLVFGAMAGLIAAFAEGGMTPNGPTLAMVGERGPEFVVPADVVRTIGAASLHGMVKDARGGGAAGSVPGGGGGGAGRVQVHNIFVQSTEAARNYIKSQEGRNAIFNIMRDEGQMG